MSLFSKTITPFRHKFDVPVMAASQVIDYDAENTLRHYRQFSPYSFLYCVNLSSCDLKILLDYNENVGIEIPSKDTNKSNGFPFYSFQVYNLSSSASIAVNEVTIWIERL